MVDGKTLTQQWNFTFEDAPVLRTRLDNVDADSQQEVICVSNSTTIVVFDNNGAVMWIKDYGEAVIATTISDQNGDGLKDLVVFKTQPYGSYYWEYWIEDVNNDITLDQGNLNLPDQILAIDMLAIDCSPIYPGDEIIAFGDILYTDSYPIFLINASAMEIENSIDLYMQPLLPCHPRSVMGTYLSFSAVNYTDDFHDFVVVLDTVNFAYWTYELTNHQFRFAEVDGDTSPELLVYNGSQLLMFNIESSTPIISRTASVWAMPLDLDLNGVQEYLLCLDITLGTLQLLNSTTLTHEVDVIPPSTPVEFVPGDYYQRDGEVAILTAKLLFIPTTMTIIDVYSLKELEAGLPTTTLLLSSLLFSQMPAQQSQTIMLLGGVRLAGLAVIVSLVFVLLRRRAVVPGS